MAPMKKYFLGLETPPYPRLSNVQACVRTNDIESVGDRHHLTFFEMMGSWSIGDYYKEKAIALAYDLLVNHFKFPPERLYATVYRGNPILNLPPDIESIRCWEKVGMPSDHIVPLGEDNFWGPAGDTGPCGPCTEVFFDTGEKYGQSYVPGGHFDDVNRYIEIWNAGVFMEFNKDKNGQFSALPMKSVDTGSGIERMYLAINGSDSLYDVDSIKPIYDQVNSILKSEEISDRDIRLVTDHIRTSTFILGEGIIPDKDGRGYIPRRLIRKSIACCIRAGVSPFELENISDNVVDQISKWYPEMGKNRNQIISVLRQEISDFTPIINSGLGILNDRLEKQSKKILTGEFIFDLVTTHGLPLEVIVDYAEKKKIGLEKEKYLEQYREHQEISRTGLKGKVAKSDDGAFFLSEKFKAFDKTIFVGYNETKAKTKVIGIIQNGTWLTSISAGNQCQLILEKTPFYAESGGQVGDSGHGFLEGSSFRITDTQKKDDIYLHATIIDQGEISVNDIVFVNIDEQKRSNISKNHTSTHLLHASLHKIIGKHAVQKGSLVNSDKLRFDFVHNKPLTEDELTLIETQVNQWIWSNFSSEISEMNYQTAIDSGAMALFSENYGDLVRVVKFDNISTELCGGTHVKSTGEIGFFLINSEASVAKGIRRIEAICGSNAFNHVKISQEILSNTSKLLKSKTGDIIHAIQKLQSKSQTKPNKTDISISEIIYHDVKEKVLNDGVKVIVLRINQDLQTLQQEAEKLLKNSSDIVLVASVFEDNIKALVKVKEELQEKYSASNLIRKWIDPFNGKGGGKPNLAKGGVNDVSQINSILENGLLIFS